MTSSEEIAGKLYFEAESVLKQKEQEFSSTHFLRLFRTLFLQEIDKLWLEHLGHMDHLRDGIGLRGYGQRDPKKEYKREGYDLFVQTLQSIKASVVDKLFRVQRLTEREVAEAEAQRKRQVEARQRAIQASHPAGGPQGQPSAEAPQQQPQGAPQGAAQGQAAANQRVVIAARHSDAARRAAMLVNARRIAAPNQQQPRPAGAPAQRAPGAAAAQPSPVAKPSSAPPPAQPDLDDEDDSDESDGQDELSTREAEARAAMQARAAHAQAQAQAQAQANAQRLSQDTVRREAPKLGRNDPCHCGSGKKYKSCHMKTDQTTAR
jgi:preprotein translocase subunit SecA